MADFWLMRYSDAIKFYFGQSLEIIVSTIDTKAPLVIEELVRSLEVQVAIKTGIILKCVLLVHI